MIIMKRSMLTGKIHELDIPVTQEQLQRWESGQDVIQNIMPNLTDDQREFLKTGSTKEEWEELFKDEE